MPVVDAHLSMCVDGGTPVRARGRGLGLDCDRRGLCKGLNEKSVIDVFSSVGFNLGPWRPQLGGYEISMQRNS